MKMKKLYIALLLGTGFNSLAQDIHFSQMLQSPLSLNPALAGANADMNAVIIYRSQWSSVASPYKTAAVSYDMRIKTKSTKGFFAAGLNFFNDQAGDANLSTNLVNLSLAYHVKLNPKSTLGGALLGGFGQRTIDFSSLQWGSQYDGFAYNGSINSGENFARSKYSYLDVGAGVVYTFRKSEKYITGNDQKAFNAGLSVYHLNRPNVSFLDNDKLKMRISAFGSFLIGLGNSRISAVPTLYFNQQGRQQEILAGSYFKYLLKEQSKYTNANMAASVAAGLFYRNKDAVIAKLMLEKSNWAAGVAYDFNTSSLTEVSRGRGGFEIFIRFVTPSPFNQSKSRI
jgi:type IX secretion system PorP/SprF family membrane protein